ncbi:SDR family NAD(P)-dependent oxidoreductase [Sphingobacterium litopenaei]|uniref:SDR family NAD(P)-dependent oxidoreductase n=1 Tax=Sphingobacterium litopenaei TaxID=2763500 RepID=A0ABR7YAZ7_9SPHI|nr:SDR family NAD(P)-dependent oxidoreductase [Sphingobacterium litopenaei]MBD1428493.1 SDR family NAD(P)-dependent oxidoreductase [Sphingobacterium litopenaei]
MGTKETKVALVTGANTGIGFQIAKALAENNYVVYIGSRDSAKGEKAALEIGRNARALQLDITDSLSVEAAVAQIQKEQGYLSLLVNNAGISNIGKNGQSMEEILNSQRASNASIEEMKAVWNTNVFSTLAVTQRFLPLLRSADNARIVVVSSALGSMTLNADVTHPYRAHFDVVYGASKAALNAVFLSLAIELEQTNIKVNMVSPGFTATALNNFQGTDTVEEGSREPIRVALSEDLPSGIFTGPGDFSQRQNVIPW